MSFTMDAGWECKQAKNIKWIGKVDQQKAARRSRPVITD